MSPVCFPPQSPMHEPPSFPFGPSSSISWIVKVLLISDYRIRPAGSQNKYSLIPTDSSRATLLSQSPVLPLPSKSEAAQPPAHQAVCISFPPLPVKCPGTVLHTPLSSGCRNMRAEFISSVTGPSFALPSVPASMGHLRAMAEKRESPAAPDAPRWPQWPPGAHLSGLLVWQACTRAWRVHFRPGHATSAQKTIYHIFPTVQESGDLQRFGNWHPKS